MISETRVGVAAASADPMLAIPTRYEHPPPGTTLRTRNDAADCGTCIYCPPSARFSNDFSLFRMTNSR